MNTKLFSKISIASIITASLLLTGCNNDSSKAEAIEQKPTATKKDDKIVVKKPEVKKEEQVTYTLNDDIVNQVFQDSAKIAPEGKKMILIFGTNTDPYSDRLKADIKASTEIQNRFKEEFSSYYLRAHENLRHKQFHEGQMMDVDTKTMIMVYGVEATPTIIFTDENGKAVIIVPGYMPTKQFLVTMDFMSQGKWKGKDRKNGEVYETLKEFYVANGIEVKGKKAE